MNQDAFYKQIKNNWTKILPHLTLPTGYYSCEIDKYFYIFANKEDMEYSKDIQGGELSAYMANSLLMVSGVPYNNNSKLLITIASQAIRSWKINSRLRDKAFVAAFGHMTKGVDAWEHFNEYMPNRYGLILNEIITK